MKRRLGVSHDYERKTMRSPLQTGRKTPTVFSNTRACVGMFSADACGFMITCQSAYSATGKTPPSYQHALAGWGIGL